jgi:hypothetical protein
VVFLGYDEELLGWCADLSAVDGFGALLDPLPAETPLDVALTDLDLDGDSDVVSTSQGVQGDGHFSWYERKAGWFSTRYALVDVDYPNGADPTDLDADGDPDLVLKRIDGFDVLIDPYGQDTDGDGLRDDVETCVVGTDPTLADSDGGGIPDGEEIAALTDPRAGGDDVAAPGETGAPSDTGETGVPGDTDLPGDTASPDDTDPPEARGEDDEKGGCAGAPVGLLGLLGLGTAARRRRR